MKRFINSIKRRIIQSERFRRVALLNSVQEGRLPEILSLTEANDLRNMLFLPASEHAAQLNQDSSRSS